MPQLDKSALRKEILQQRQSLSFNEWQHKSKQICDRLGSNRLFKEAQTIFAYFSFRQEPDLSPLFKLDKNWAFPRCVGKSLIWHSWQPETPLKSGKYGILEPFDTASAIDAATADLILVPTVACDKQGYRLGYGGGFYDRLLSTERGLTATTIGIVFDFAHGVELLKDSWDMPLSFVCTETDFYKY